MAYSLSIDVFPVCYGYDEYNKSIIINLVDHTIRTHSDPPSGSTGELLAAGRPRIRGEVSDSLNDARMLVAVDLCYLLLGSAENLDRIAHLPYSS
jgi:hypothetical protein